jgi:D-alanyl-D-alanine carboxypeptidase (penicillin-binding protein 5/6)
MTALIVAETIPNLATTTITLTPAMLSQDGDEGLIVYTHWSAAELMEFMLVASSNDAAAALVATSEPYLGGQHFLDINNETEPGAYGSARDIAKLLAHILETKPIIFEMTRKDTATTPEYLRFTPLASHNTNGILNTIPWLVGSKTGFTDHAGGNLAIVFDAGLSHPVAAVVLGSTITGRFTDMELLIKTTFEEL